MHDWPLSAMATAITGRKNGWRIHAVSVCLNVLVGFSGDALRQRGFGEKTNSSAIYSPTFGASEYNPVLQNLFQEASLQKGGE